MTSVHIGILCKEPYYTSQGDRGSEVLINVSIVRELYSSVALQVWVLLM